MYVNIYIYIYIYIYHLYLFQGRKFLHRHFEHGRTLPTPKCLHMNRRKGRGHGALCAIQHLRVVASRAAPERESA